MDPQEYLRVLPELLPVLPAGAAEFASDPDHYDFGSSRCVKDLTLDRVDLVDDHVCVSLDLSLGPNEWKHEGGLRIRYSGVRDFWVRTDDDAGGAGGFGLGGGGGFVECGDEVPRLGDLQLDELLPHPHGFSHEIAFTEGALLVVGADLVARWERPASRPEI
ncbi:hypothetical protein OOK13_14090 [Streptomyces sp. NBC_00378]|uniref:hypothetical protein n=1 Tax=unclassified Streptomyces TaxID=2593676 RepID=UPI0022548666|nr:MULTISPECIES: hypothetical protein [unclassified Streptomyces]MCX5109649.1 hypothetical protein [Streptomyces sp. NBC_00378]